MKQQKMKRKIWIEKCREILENQINLKVTISMDIFLNST